MIHDPVLAHELRTPLHGVLAAAALLLDSSLGSEQRELAETIREAATALLRIADESLGTTAIPADAACDPRAVVDGVRRLLDPVARAKGVALDVDVDADVPACVAAPDGPLRQVLVNLVGNAVKFTTAGGVAVRVRRVETAVRFEVRDTGPGLDAAGLTALFRPRDAALGTPSSGAGLGLAISAALARRMGGDVGAESTLGRGSTFWVSVKTHVGARDSGLGASARPVATAPRVARHTSRVLLLDDDPVGRRVTARMVERLGCRVDVVGRVVEAEEALRRARYDVVLLDCALPDGDGCGVARWVRRGEGGAVRTRLVALTASPDAATHARCLTAGMDACLVKPATLDALAAAVVGPLPARSAVHETTDADVVIDAVIDDARIEALVRLDAESPGLLARVAADYAAGASRQLFALEAAVAAGDAAAVARAAHAVRGSSASAGAARAAALAAAIERAAARAVEAPPGDVRRSAAVLAAAGSVDALHDAVVAAAVALERRAAATVTGSVTGPVASSR